MGSWGFGAFDNDTAADFADDFDEASEDMRLSMLRTALTDVNRSVGRVDGARAESALAAAALVACTLVGGEEFQRENHGNIISSIPGDLISVAGEVADLIINSENDVKEYWSRTSDIDKWFAMVSRLRTVLTGQSSSARDTLW